VRELKTLGEPGAAGGERRCAGDVEGPGHIPMGPDFKLQGAKMVERWIGVRFLCAGPLVTDIDPG